MDSNWVGPKVLFVYLFWENCFFRVFLKSTFLQHFRRSFPLFQRVTMLLSLFSPWEWKGVDYLGYQCIHQWIELHWPGLLVLGGVTWFDYLFNCLLIYSFWNQKSSYGFTEAMLKIQCSNKHSQTAGAFNLSPFRLTFPRNFSAATPGFGSRRIDRKCELVGARG